jgi:UDP-glucose 4-epimerase
MKHLVTGGAGFIGSNIAQRLAASGRHVRVLDDLSSGDESNLSSIANVEFIHASILDDEVLADATADVDVVYHLAASVGNKRSIEYPLLDSQINVLGTLKVLEASRASGVRKIVFSSSAGIFGELKQLPIREDHPLEPDSPYGASKLCAEKMCLAYAKLYDLEAVCLRYFNVYGPNQRFDEYGNVIPIFAYRMLHGEPIVIFGDGEQTRDFVSVHDIVQANLKAGQSRGVSGAFNIASGTRITILRLAQLLQEVSGIRAEIRHGPPRSGDVRHSLADISAARTTFGYEPSVDLQSGLCEYMQWISEELAACRNAS